MTHVLTSLTFLKMEDNFVDQYDPFKILRYVVNSQVFYTVTQNILIIHNNNLFNSQVTYTVTHYILIIHNNNLFNSQVTNTVTYYILIIHNNNLFNFQSTN